MTFRAQPGDPVPLPSPGSGGSNPRLLDRQESHESVSQTDLHPRQYRADIDGLRAIAVLAVMVYHARDTVLPGGFVGVDVFFVISGYLISRQIASEAAAGRFSLAEFYRRRIRRIAPMMLTVIAATLAAAITVMVPEDAAAVAKSAFWSVASLANVHFWRDLDTGYFASSTAEVPLLHLWSLGVEEQFYILWPLLLAAGVRRMRAGWLLWSIVAVAALSFWAAARVFTHDPMFAYYMLPTRAGELMLGALLGVASAQGRIAPGLVSARLACAAGLALIAGSLWLIDKRDPFPGWFAVPPTLGAALVLLAGEGRRADVVPGLSSAPMVFLGKISYSAYLWHWPLFAFFRYGFGEPGAAASLAILATTILLAWASFEFIERPTRNCKAALPTVAIRHLALPGGALLLLAMLVIYGPRFGLPIAPPSERAQLATVREMSRPVFTLDWICQRQRLTAADMIDERCVVGADTDAEPVLLLWGDSNAAHYVPMIREFAREGGVRFRNVAVGACPPMLVDPAPYADARRVTDCRHSNALVRAALHRYPVIAISAAWSGYAGGSRDFFAATAALARHLTSQSHKVILIGRIPILKDYDQRCEEKAVRMPFKTCATLAQPMDDEVERTNEALRQVARQVHNVSYFDANRWLCPDRVCSDKTPAGSRRYVDSSHLTSQGAEELGRKVLHEAGLPEPFAALRSLPGKWASRRLGSWTGAAD